MDQVNVKRQPTRSPDMITNQHADSDNFFNPKMFCGLYCVKDNELPPFLESDEER